jgi:hypothetical protein
VFLVASLRRAIQQEKSTPLHARSAQESAWLDSNSKLSDLGSGTPASPF